MEHEISPPSATADRVCRNHTACILNQTYEINPPSSASDRACAPVTTCSALRPEVVPPTLTSNRACSGDCVMTPWGSYSACTASCDGGTQTRTRQVLLPHKEGGEPCPPESEWEETRTCNDEICPCEPGTALTDGSCVACEIGFYSSTVGQEICLAWTTCQVGKYVSAIPSLSSDRECLDCHQGRYSSSTNLARCTAATPCPAGHEEVVAPTPSSNRACQEIPTSSSDGALIGGLAAAAGVALGVMSYAVRKRRQSAPVGDAQGGGAQGDGAQRDGAQGGDGMHEGCLLYTSPSPRDS